MRSSTTLSVIAFALVPCTAGIAQDRESVVEPAEISAPVQIGGVELVDPVVKLESMAEPLCGRPRQVELKPHSASPTEMRELQNLGKLKMLDVQTGQVLTEHITDYLPAGWGKAVSSDQRSDSLGRPIVNEVDGLPGWSDYDVARLRAAILETSRELRELPGPTAEVEWRLGDLIGQALVRQIDIADLVDLEDSELISKRVGDAILDELHFYENLKRQRADSMGYVYQATSYGDAVVDFVESRGGSTDQILSIDDTESADAPDVVPSGCYDRQEFTRGMSILASPTFIWDVSGQDDASADVPIGFLFYFYGCDLPDHNVDVRVSTNGYLSFFEQGGGAMDGTDFSNDPITSTFDPDGMVAPYWDDLWVAPAQGSPDRVGYQTEGAVGERVFTVEWFSVSTMGSGGADFHYFQAKLFEASGNLELHFYTLWNSDPVDSATVGLEDFDGLDGDCGPNCDATNTGETIPNNYRFAPNRPLNDQCGIGQVNCLAADQPVLSGSNLGATGTDVSSCATNDIHDVWFWYHSPVGDPVTFDTCSATNFDTTVSLFDDCYAATSFACNDDSCGLQSSVTASLTTGANFFVRVGGYGGRQGDYTITATPTGFPAGDTCSDAWTLGTSFSGYTRNNSGCIDESSCAFGDTIDEWFRWTAPASGLATFTTCNPATDFDTSLTAFDSCGGTQVACNDDSTGSLCSTLRLTVAEGEIYYLRVAGYGFQYGDYELTATVDTDTYFADDFEAGLGNWTPTGLWNLEYSFDACGSIVAPYPAPNSVAAYYGQDGVCTYNTGAANSGSLTLDSPVILPAGSPAYLSIWSHEETECGGDCTWDNRRVEVSTNGGTTWQALTDEAEFEGQWYHKIFSLNDFAGMSILLRFTFDTGDELGNDFFGWMIDGVRIGRTAFQETFEQTQANWSMTGLWNGESEMDTCGALVAPFPDPSQAMYYGQDGVCTYDTATANSGELTFDYPIMLPPDEPLAMRFWSYEETECGGDCSWDTRDVLVSNDFGTTWTQLGRLGNENEWYQPILSLAGYADQPILVRFAFDTGDSMANTYFGWMVDGIDLTTNQIFADGFESGDTSAWSMTVP